MAGTDIRTTLTTLLPRLRRFGLSLTNSAELADELVRNAFMRALRHAVQPVDQTRMDAWLYGLMHAHWATEDRLNTGRAASTAPPPASGRMTLDRVRQTLASLPADHRAILVLVCVDGLSYQETAEVLGIPVETVMHRLSQARHDLHIKLFGQAAAATVTPFPARAGRDGARSA